MPNEVVIDGVRYVPVIESSPSMGAIARGLASVFWGESSKPTSKMLNNLTVRVYDDGDGEPIQDVLALIANELAKEQSNG